MPRAVPLPLRQLIHSRQRRGHAPSAIARDLQLPLRTVQHLLRRFRLHPDALAPAYPRGPRSSHPLASLLLDCRRAHPTWGAPLIRVQFCRDYPPDEVPSARTLQRWFRRHGLSPAPPGRRERTGSSRADRPHAVWQMDAAEHLPLSNGSEVSWLRLVDECSGAFLATQVFPPRPVELGARARGA
jgi:hypothetical protein